MKKIAPIILFSLFCWSTADAQCVVYVSTSTGAWAAQFNGANEYATITELDAAAAYDCKMTNRGYACELFMSSNRKGWWAITVGSDQSGYIIIGGAEGEDTELKAINSSQKIYMKQGGMPAAGQYESTAWYVK